MFRFVVTYDRYLGEKRPSLTKRERVYFETDKDALSWMDAFMKLAKNCINFELEELPYA